MSIEHPSVLFLTQAYPDDSISYRGIFVKELAICLSNSGMKITVVTPRIYPESKPHEREGGIDVFRFPFPSGGKPLIAHSGIPIVRMMVYLIACFFRTRTTARRFGCDLIHVHWIHPNGLIALLIKSLSGRPFIVHVRGTDLNVFALKNAFFRVLTRAILSRSHAIVCTSNALKQRILTAFPDVIKKEIRVEVIYNAVDISLFHPIREKEARETLGIPVEGLHFLFVGNLVEEKGILDLLEVMAAIVRVRENHPVHLHVVGTGPLKDTIEKRITSLKDRILLHDVVSHREIPLWLNASNLLILPSRAEGMPNVVLEALACGIPVLATRVGDIPEFVVGGESGFLMDTKRVKEELEVILEDIIDTPRKIKDMKEKLQENLHAQETIGAARCEAFAKVYRETIMGSAK